jgi:hypothetical protein
VLWTLLKHIPQMETPAHTFTQPPCSLSASLANLRALTSVLSAFYENVLKRACPTFDLLEIARNHSEEHIVKLFMAVLGAAIESDCKQLFI